MYSDKISDAIKFLNTCKEEYSIAEQKYEEANSQIQDLMHMLELGDVSYHDGGKIARALSNIRVEKRNAETTMIQLKPVIAWLADNTKTMNSMEKLLGEVRKAEKISDPDNRHYTQRTTIIKDVLGHEFCLL